MTADSPGDNTDLSLCVKPVIQSYAVSNANLIHNQGETIRIHKPAGMAIKIRVNTRPTQLHCPQRLKVVAKQNTCANLYTRRIQGDTFLVQKATSPAVKCPSNGSAFYRDATNRLEILRQLHASFHHDAVSHNRGPIRIQYPARTIEPASYLCTPEINTAECHKALTRNNDAVMDIDTLRAYCPQGLDAIGEAGPQALETPADFRTVEIDFANDLGSLPHEYCSANLDPARGKRNPFIARPHQLSATQIKSHSHLGTYQVEAAVELTTPQYQALFNFDARSRNRPTAAIQKVKSTQLCTTDVHAFRQCAVSEKQWKRNLGQAQVNTTVNLESVKPDASLGYHLRSCGISAEPDNRPGRYPPVLQFAVPRDLLPALVQHCSSRIAISCRTDKVRFCL
jgi:hypothetical protein